MAVVSIPDQNRRIEKSDEISAFLKPFGLWYEFWGVDGRVSETSTDAEILSAYKPEIDRVMKDGGYTTVDVINVTAETPGIDALLRGARPAELPIEQPRRFQFVLNLKVAHRLGLTIPPAIALQADEVIE